MDKERFYKLEKICQECNEIGMMASKSKIFGFESFGPRETKNNLELLMEELIDLEVAVEKLLENNTEIQEIYMNKRTGVFKADKRAKYEHYIRLFMES